MTRFVFTAHAVERYQTRHAPHRSHYDAMTHLETIALRAGREKFHTALGQDIWSVEDAGVKVYLVTKHEFGQHICVTVLTEAQVNGGAPSSSLPVGDDEDSADRIAALMLSVEPLRAKVDEQAAEIAILRAQLVAKQVEAEEIRGLSKRHENHIAQIEAGAMGRASKEAAKTERHRLNMLQSDSYTHLRTALRLLRGIAMQEYGLPHHSAANYLAGLPDWTERLLQDEPQAEVAE